MVLSIFVLTNPTPKGLKISELHNTPLQILTDIISFSADTGMSAANFE